MKKKQAGIVEEEKKEAGGHEFRVKDEKISDVTAKFHYGQSKAFRSDKRWVVVLAGLQSGKTCMGPYWLMEEIRQRGAGDYLVVSSSFPLLDKKALPEFKQVFIDDHNWGTYYESRKQFISKDGQVKVFFGTADKANSLESSTAKAAWCDEAGQDEFTRAAWEAIRGRLSIHRGRALFTTTLYNFGWLKSEFYDRWMDGDEDVEVVQFESIMNPAFPKEEFEEQRKRLPQWLFDMRYRGIYSKPAGLIYDSFDTACIVPRFELPKTYPRFVGHDFGFNNTAAVWVALEPPTGRYIIYRTYLAGGMSVPSHAAKFRQLSGSEAIQVKQGGSHQEQEIRDAYALAGWAISEPSTKSVQEQISTVYGLHKANRIIVFDDLYEYLHEKQTYSYELDEDYNRVDRISNKERYHLMDAERYIFNFFRPDVAERVGFGKRTIIPVQVAY